MAASETSNSTPPAPIAEPLALLDRLHRRAWEFDFFQAVWLLERYCHVDTPVGERGPAAREPLRFRPNLSLAFPATDVCGLTQYGDPATGAPRYLVEVAFLGLYGGSTPLPLHYAISVLRATDAATAAERSAEEKRDYAHRLPGASPIRDFIDIFHHRLIALFYRAWLKYRHDRMFSAPRRDVITEYLRFLIGCSPDWDEAVLGVPPIRLLRYAGLLTQHPRSATTLAGMLFDYWGDIPVRVESFVGQWVPLDPADLNRVGLLNSRLGVDLTVGDQVYDRGGVFNTAVGPVDWATYQSFVPGGFRYRQNRALTRLYCCDPLGFTLQVTLRPGEVPPMHLTSEEGGSALGMTSWVRSQDMGETTVTFAASEETTATFGGLPGSGAAAGAATERSSDHEPHSYRTEYPSSEAAAAGSRST